MMEYYNNQLAEIRKKRYDEFECLCVNKIFHAVINEEQYVILEPITIINQMNLFVKFYNVNHEIPESGKIIISSYMIEYFFERNNGRFNIKKLGEYSCTCHLFCNNNGEKLCGVVCKDPSCKDLISCQKNSKPIELKIYTNK